MGKRVDEKTRNTIVRLLFHRCRQSEIAKELGVSPPVIKKIERNLMDYGTPTKPETKFTGRPPTMKPEVVEALLEQFERTGLEYGQKELKSWLKDNYEVDVSQSTISRIITKSGRKKAIAILANNRKLAADAESSQKHPGLVWLGGPPDTNDASSPASAAEERAQPNAEYTPPTIGQVPTGYQQAQEVQLDPQLPKI